MGNAYIIINTMYPLQNNTKTYTACGGFFNIYMLLFSKKAKATFDWASVLHNSSINWALNVTLVLLNTFTHHLVETLFTYHIFVSISMPVSNYVLYMLFIFHSHFYSLYNQSYIFIKRDTIVLFHIFSSKVQPQGVA